MQNYVLISTVTMVVQARDEEGAKQEAKAQLQSLTREDCFVTFIDVGQAYKSYVCPLCENQVRHTHDGELDPEQF